MTSSPRKQGGIQAARLSKTLHMADSKRHALADGATFTQLEFPQTDCAAQVAYRLHFEEVLLAQINGTMTRFEHMRMEVALSICTTFDSGQTA